MEYFLGGQEQYENYINCQTIGYLADVFVF